MSERSASTQLQRANEEYDGLLSSLEDTTVRLISAIGAWDSSEVGALIESRSAICDRIAESVQTLATLGARHQPVSERLDALAQRVSEKEQLVLSRQAEAERALAGELGRRRPILATINQTTDKQEAYRKRSAVGHGRFLDSRM